MINIGIACPALFIIIPLTKNRSEYPMTTAKLEFFVKLRYWLVTGGIIILKACGNMINLSD